MNSRISESCNIGPAEIAHRRRTGLIGLLASTIMLVTFLVINEPSWLRVAIALPFFFMTSGFLQARYKFCANYGLFGLQALAELNQTEQVADVYRLADRNRALRLLATAAAVSVVCTTIVVLLPI